MAKQPIKLAAEINDRMRREGKQILTMPWSEFYTEAQIERFRDERAEDIKEACVALGIVVGYGKNVVTFCNDANFSS